MGACSGNRALARLTKDREPMKHSLESLPRRIFLDSCTAQTLRNHGGYINADEPIDASDRIHRVTDGIANIEALRNIFLVNECALFEWIVSSGSLHEAGTILVTCSSFGISRIIPMSA